MSMIGVLGGLGPAATVDFLDKVVRLTPAQCDQEHIPVVTASLPHVPDRSTFILGRGADPLPFLLKGIDLLNEVGVKVVVIPCNSSHHWYSQLSQRSRAPILHIASACVQRLRLPFGSHVLVLATSGAIRSGFYQRELNQAGMVPVEPDAQAIQPLVDNCIRQIKAGELEAGGVSLSRVFEQACAMEISAVILGCTELPIAAQYCDPKGLQLADSTLMLAHAAVEYAVQRRWHLSM